MSQTHSRFRFPAITTRHLASLKPTLRLRTRVSPPRRSVKRSSIASSKRSAHRSQIEQTEPAPAVVSKQRADHQLEIETAEPADSDSTEDEEELTEEESEDLAIKMIQLAEAHLEIEFLERKLATMRAEREAREAEETRQHMIRQQEIKQADAGDHLERARASLRNFVTKVWVPSPNFEEPPTIDPGRRLLMESDHKNFLPPWMAGIPYPHRDWRDNLYKEARSSAPTPPTETREVHHYSFYGNPVYKKSATPPSISLWATRTKAALATTHKHMNEDKWSYKSILINEALNFIDPYTIDGITSFDEASPNLYQTIKSNVKRCYDFSGNWDEDNWSGEEKPQRLETAINSFEYSNVEEDLPIIFDLDSFDLDSMDVEQQQQQKIVVRLPTTTYKKEEKESSIHWSQPWDEIVAEAENGDDDLFDEFIDQTSKMLTAGTGSWIHTSE